MEILTTKLMATGHRKITLTASALCKITRREHSMWMVYMSHKCRIHAHSGRKQSGSAEAIIGGADHWYCSGLAVRQRLL